MCFNISFCLSFKSSSSAQVHVSDRQVVTNLNLELQGKNKIIDTYNLKFNKNI